MSNQLQLQIVTGSCQEYTIKEADFFLVPFKKNHHFPCSLSGKWCDSPALPNAITPEGIPKKKHVYSSNGDKKLDRRLR